jgi:hypothetical protein
MSVSGTAGSWVAESGSVPPELVLLLESSPGSLGAGSVGKGCSSAADFGVAVVGLGESGGGADLLGAPGNGNCSAADGAFAPAGGVQGLVVWFWVWVWFGSGHGGSGGFWVGVVWARQAAEKKIAASSARNVVGMVISPGTLSDTLTMLLGGLL